MSSITQTATKAFTSLKPSPIGGSVKAKLNFYEAPADGAAPFNYVETPPEGQPQRNFHEQEREVTIEDLRGNEASVTLDHDAVQIVRNVSSAETEFLDDEHIKATYYPECEKVLLDNVPGAHKVIFFDHTIRRSGPNAHRAPVTRAHVDQTGKSAAERVRLHASSPEEAEQLLNGRYRIINVWRPINGTVEAHPLAFASAATVNRDQDLIPVQHRYPDRTGETAQVQYSPSHRWLYLSSMENEERLLLQCWDSVGDAKALPHTAFVDPNTPANAKGRESIEVRALVFG